MLKIAVTGPESVGKSTLSATLAEQFGGAFVPEFAREYIGSLNHKYTYSDVEKIARQQIEEYNNAEHLIKGKQPIVFFDTFLIITKVWFEVVFNKVPQWLPETIKQKPMDLYLLCYPDLPWEADNVRENGNNRMELFERYRQNLNNYGFNYHIISGKGSERVEMAIQKINATLYEQPKISG
jgi:NadR type nicotinamide-nucleotide adenylyltransferase